MSFIPYRIVSFIMPDYPRRRYHASENKHQAPRSTLAMHTRRSKLLLCNP